MENSSSRSVLPRNEIYPNHSLSFMVLALKRWWSLEFSCSFLVFLESHAHRAYKPRIKIALELSREFGIVREHPVILELHESRSLKGLSGITEGTSQ